MFFLVPGFLLLGTTKIPLGQHPILVYAGEVSLQTQSGKLVKITLSTHDIRYSAPTVPTPHPSVVSLRTLSGKLVLSTYDIRYSDPTVPAPYPCDVSLLAWPVPQLFLHPTTALFSSAI